MPTLGDPALFARMHRRAPTRPTARPTLATKLPKLAEESIGLLAALVGDVHSPLGPQEQQEDGKVGVQHGTHIDDQESSCSSPEQVRHWSGSGPVQVAQDE